MTIGMPMVIIACVTITAREECTQIMIKGIVHVNTSLQREQSLRLCGIILQECLYVIVTQVSTKAPFRCQIKVLSNPIEKCSGKLLVNTHKMGTNAHDIISRTIPIPKCEIKFRTGTGTGRPKTQAAGEARRRTP